MRPTTINFLRILVAITNTQLSWTILSSTTTIDQWCRHSHHSISRFKPDIPISQTIHHRTRKGHSHRQGRMVEVEVRTRGITSHSSWAMKTQILSTILTIWHLARTNPTVKIISKTHNSSTHNTLTTRTTTSITTQNYQTATSISRTVDERQRKTGDSKNDLTTLSISETSMTMVVRSPRSITTTGKVMKGEWF